VVRFASVQRTLDVAAQRLQVLEKDDPNQQNIDPEYFGVD